MPKTSFILRIPVITGGITSPTTGMIAKVRFYGYKQLKTVIFNGCDAKSLHLKGLTDNLFYKHGFLLG
jgi:hypothetical protein